MQIRTANIVKVYNKKESNMVKALNGVSLSIEQGESVAIMGVSGSGKSTLLHILGCLDIPTEGEYFFKDENVSLLSASKMAELRNESFGFILQDGGLLSTKQHTKTSKCL